MKNRRNNITRQTMSERELYLFEDTERKFVGISEERFLWLLIFQRAYRDARGYGGNNQQEVHQRQAIQWLKSDWCFYIAELLFGSEGATINRNWAKDDCPKPRIARKRKAQYEMEVI